MSTASLPTPPSPVQHQDIRAAAQPFKREKDHVEKWISGERLLAGQRRVFVDRIPGGDGPKWSAETVSEDVKKRPSKSFSQVNNLYKTHANKNPRFSPRTWEYRTGSNRMNRKIEAQVEANSDADISRSMLELLPHHIPTPSFRIQTVVRAPNDDEMLDPTEYCSPSPVKKGRAVGLGGLVEKAEVEFLDKQTELMVNEDYEVLDADGERVVLKSDKKRKGSPKQKATKDTKVEEDDGFELI